MKKLFLSAFLVLACLSACQKNEMSAPVAKGEVLYATIEDVASTRTVKDENNNISWSEGDQIIAFMNSTLGVKYQVLPSSVGKTSASFEEVSTGGLNAGTELDHIVAYYPYDEGIECMKDDGNYKLNVIFPIDQNYAENSFGKDSFPMVAISIDNNLTFKNIGGAIKLQLKGLQKIICVRLEGKSNEKLSGNAQVKVFPGGDKPVIEMADYAFSYMCLYCREGVQLNEMTPTEFILSVPPVIFSKGFTVTITDSYGQDYVIDTDKANTVYRSSLLVMPPVVLDPPNEDCNFVYIDEYGINHGQGFRIGETIWSPVNCGYHKDEYPYGKLYQWGRKYGQGYSGPLCDYRGNSVGMISDATNPVVLDGPVSFSDGQKDVYANTFFTVSEYPYDWCLDSNDKLWNAGTEELPEKTPNDPCPDGWRVPTYAELLALNESYMVENDIGQQGRWMAEGVSFAPGIPAIFLPAAGCRNNIYSDARKRNYYGYYWTSRPQEEFAFYFYFYYDSYGRLDGAKGLGASVRCVLDSSKQETDSESNIVTNLSPNGQTANCYIVPKAGSYKFLPTKGNSMETVGEITDVAVLWESFGTDVIPNDGDLIANVEYVDGYIKFDTPEKFTEGNAVLCAVNGNGILWTWHIWLTDQPKEQVYFNNAGTMMDRNLGAISSVPGDVGSLGLLYQWGRKDPFLNSSSISENVLAKSSSGWPAAVEWSLTTGTVEYVTLHPMVFITTWTLGGENWCYSSSNTELWNSSKTIYDPCPAGWRVPDGGENGVWAKAFGDSSDYKESSLYDSVNMGIDFSGYLGSDACIWYPSTGLRQPVDAYGSLYYVGTSGSYWSVTPYTPPYTGANTRWACTFHYSSTGSVAPSTTNSRSSGLSVRCVQE